jgi:hypothetical protein
MNFQKNPAIYIALIGAFLTLLSAFGIALTEGKTQAIMGFATVAIPILIGVFTRANVYSPDSAQTALNMPAGSSTELLDKVIAADVTVFPGETKAQVAAKVNNAEVQ